MDQKTQLCFIVIIIVGAYAHRADRAMHYQPYSTGEEHFIKVSKNAWVFLVAVQGLEAFKTIPLQPEVEVGFYGKDIPEACRHKIMPTEPFDEKCSAVL